MGLKKINSDVQCQNEECIGKLKWVDDDSLVQSLFDIKVQTEMNTECLVLKMDDNFGFVLKDADCSDQYPSDCDCSPAITYFDHKETETTTVISSSSTNSMENTGL